MEFSIDDLNRIIMDLSDEPSVQSRTHVNSSTSTTAIKQEPSSSNEEKQQTFTTTNNMTDRQYYLIIFNNRSWSQRLQKRSPPVGQQHPQIDHGFHHIENRVVDNVSTSSPSDVALDDLFIVQLRQLINDYMSRTKRPFPIKYFLDFTTY